MLREVRNRMKNISLAVLFSLSFLSNQASSQALTGTVREGLTIDSEILRTTVRYTIYLPFDYTTSTRSYPVVYLLHGGNGDETTWIHLGEVHLTADALILNRSIPPMIMVMPAAGNSRYVNNYDNSVRYEDFFFDEFIPYIESVYRIVSDKRSRSVLGSSMGGYGSLVYALRHPDVFAAGVSFAGSFCEDERVLRMSDEQWNRSTRGPVYGLDLHGEDRFTDHYRAYDPCHIVENGDPETLSTVSLYLDCGDDDFRNDGNAALHILMRRMGIPHEYRVRNGAHGMPYVRTGLAEGLQFIGEAFRGS